MSIERKINKSFEEINKKFSYLCFVLKSKNGGEIINKIDMDTLEPFTTRYTGDYFNMELKSKDESCILKITLRNKTKIENVLDMINEIEIDLDNKIKEADATCLELILNIMENWKNSNLKDFVNSYDYMMYSRNIVEQLYNKKLSGNNFSQWLSTLNKGRKNKLFMYNQKTFAKELSQFKCMLENKENKLFV